MEQQDNTQKAAGAGVEPGAVRKVRKSRAGESKKKAAAVDRQQEIDVLVGKFLKNAADRVNKNIGQVITDELGTGLYFTMAEGPARELVDGIRALYETKQ